MKAKVKSLTNNPKAIGLVTKHGTLWLSRSYPAYATKRLRLAFPGLRLESWGIDLETVVGKFAHIHAAEREVNGCVYYGIEAGD